MNIQAKYILKDNLSEKPTSIKFYFYKDKKKFVYSLGIDCKIHPELWDAVRMRPITIQAKENRAIIKRWKNSHPNIKTEIHNIRSRINDAEKYTNQFLSNQYDSGPFDPDHLRQYLDEHLKPVKKRSSKDKRTISFLGYLSSLKKGMEQGKILKTSGTGLGTAYSPNTIKAYGALETIIGQFLKANRRKDLVFDKVDAKFYKDLQTYIYGLDFGPNHFGNLIKNIKAVMKRAQLEKLHMNESYKSFRKTSNESDSIALTETELTRMFSFKFKPEDEYLAKYRDLFLVGAYTAMRFSDYSRLDKSNFKTLETGELVITMTHKKTDRKVIVPVKEELRLIMERYEYQLPVISEQKMNKNIKDVGERVGINESITITKYKGPNQTQITVPKYKLIKSHVARSTGCTIFYKAGIPAIDIMSLSGHKTEKEFLKYLKIGPEDTARRIAKNPIFKKSKPVLKVVGE